MEKELKLTAMEKLKIAAIEYPKMFDFIKDELPKRFINRAGTTQCDGTLAAPCGKMLRIYEFNIFIMPENYGYKPRVVCAWCLKKNKELHGGQAL